MTSLGNKILWQPYTGFVEKVLTLLFLSIHPLAFN